jgi:membrane associated rhomboid family serine protease
MRFEMTSGADLFVVCKQCGSEVSPYITECPYCGHRLRRRAPKLPKPGEESVRNARRVKVPALGRLRRGQSAATRVDPPYATMGLVLAACVVWVVAHARPITYFELTILGPLHGEWWRLISSQFTYLNGYYEFVTLSAVALFGWLLERRHGPVLVLALFLGAGVTGALAALASQGFPVVTGGLGGALALLAAWAVPDLQDARAGRYYEGDLLGTAAIAVVLLAMPLALTEVSWLAGLTGAVIGLLLGYGLNRTRAGLS